MIVVDATSGTVSTATFGDNSLVVVVKEVTRASTDLVEAMSKLGISAIEAGENIRAAMAALSRYFIEPDPGFLADPSPAKRKVEPAPTQERRGHASDRRRRWSRWIYGLG